MEIKIIDSVKNPLLKREELSLNIFSESNPSFSEIKKKLGKNEELSVVKNVKGNFGRKEFHCCVFVYDSKESMNATEKISRKERRKQAEEAKKAEEAKTTPVKTEEKK